LVSGYAQSKWVAEKLITRASHLGLPVVIYRLGSICASTRTGACNRNDIHTLLLAAIMKLDCYPETAVNTHLNGLPVDFTAKSVVYLSDLQSNMYGKIYHVFNPDSKVSFEDIINGIHSCNVQLVKVSHAEWRVKLKAITNRDSPFESAGEFLTDSAVTEGSTVSAIQFCSAISALDFPSLDKEYVFKWLNFVLHHIVR
jgi:thioester reductase-like protein